MSSNHSRVFRQVVVVEVLWTVEPGMEPPLVDTEAHIADGLAGATPSGLQIIPGAMTLGPVEELVPPATDGGR